MTPGGDGEHAMVKHRLYITRAEEAQETMRNSCARAYGAYAEHEAQIKATITTHRVKKPQECGDECLVWLPKGEPILGTIIRCTGKLNKHSFVFYDDDENVTRCAMSWAVFARPK